MAEIKNNKKLLVLIIPAVLVIIAIVAIKFKNSNNQPTEEISGFEKTEIPDVIQETDTITSKVKLYEMEEKNATYKEEIENRNNKDLDDMISEMEREQANKEPIAAGNEKELSEKIETKTVNQETPKPVKKRLAEKNTSANTTKKQSPTETTNQLTTKPPKEEQTEEYTGYGLGVVKSNNTPKATTNKTTEFIPAYIEDDVTIKRGTGFTLLIDKDFELDGVKYKKYSVAYAKAIGGGDKMDIIITMIENAKDGSKNNVNLYVYNENYIKGIDYPGSVSEGIKQTGNDLVDQAAGYTGGVGSLGSRTKRNLSEKERTIDLYSRYRVYLKKE